MLINDTYTSKATPGVAVVTGASRGIGLEFVNQLQAAGWEVEACNRPTVDIGDPSSILAFAQALQGRPIDLLINNAAIRGDTGGIATLETDGFIEVMRVNTLGPILMVQALLSNLKLGRGIVANISSQSGSIAEGRSTDGDYAYKCSKAALNIASCKLADETGLTVLALHPGWVQTDMGGPFANVPVTVSVEGMLRIISAAGPSDSASFRTYDNNVVEW